MKKFAWLAAILLLAGCTGGEDGDTTDTTNTTDTSVAETTQTSEVSSIEESIADTATESLPEESSEESRGGGGDGPASSDTAGADTTGASGDQQALTLHIPDTLRESEGTQIYTDVMGVAEEFTAENATLGEEGLFTLSYTGFWIENEGGPLQGFFMGVNRTGQPLTNLSFTLNFLVGDSPVWENTVFTLHEEEFGTQPVDTAMPIFLDVPPGNEELLQSAQPGETFIEIFDLQVN